MAKLSPAELKQRLAQDLPGALVEPHAPANGNGNGATEPATKPALRHGQSAPVNLLATEDALVRPDALPQVALYVRDTLGYALLSNITAVDYLKEQLIEVVYHFFHLDGGPELVVKTRVPRDAAQLPSITPFWPGADFQEREAYDLYGVVFSGHPDLRRIYMWDEFEGFPMRKDFPKQGDKYFEADGE
ncbi:MAG: NADH-quinone oxidoreductase subunit C [Roseiflexaceae bacterium]